jgi:hypothetical protein
MPIQSLPAPPAKLFWLPEAMNTMSLPSPPRRAIQLVLEPTLKLSLPAPPSTER